MHLDAPITIEAKMLMQKTFTEKLGWDDDFSDEIQREWNSYKEELPLIRRIKIDHRLKTVEN